MIGRTLPHIASADARRLFMQGLAMLDEPAEAAPLRALLDRLGFVQLDSINIVERAHHHILWTRWPGYQPTMLDTLYEQRAAFEHWTHDASLIPLNLYPHWRRKFERYSTPGVWMRDRLGPDQKRLTRAVLGRIRAEGPLMSKDFADPPTAKPGKADAAGWWNWKPQKAALEYLWRTGELVIARRVNFNKVYDLSERVIPEVLRAAAISEQEHIAWACTSALDRLGTATPREIAAFWNAITIQEARAWCTAAAREGRIIPVTIDGIASSGPRLRPGPSNGDASKQRLHHAFAIADYPLRLARALQPPAGVRLLSPFDPLIRDRQRTHRLFGFEYRFEAFTPAAKRKYGYYTLPILEGDRLIGRADPALDRAEGKLDIRIYWEPGIKATRPRIAALREAVAAYARFNNAENFTISR